MSKEGKVTSEAAIVTKLRQAAVLIQECIDEAVKHRPTKGGKAQSRVITHSTSPKLDFETNERNFVRTHGVRLAGSRKFVLLLAYLAKGELSRETRLKTVEKMWNRMTALLGGEFNRKYSNEAREKGWVDTKKRGLYVLRPTWREILTGS
jgi:hypothetical protein